MTFKLAGLTEQTALVAFRPAGVFSWSHGTLEQRVRGLAGTLADQNGAVLLMAEPGLWATAVTFACLQSGTVLAPLDTSGGPDFAARVASSLDARLLVVDRRLAATWAAGWRGLLPPTLAVAFCDGSEDAEHVCRWMKNPDSWAPKGLDADAPAVVFHTSGTTAAPKGVVLSRANLAYQVKALERLELVRPGQVLLNPLPVFHVYPFVVGLVAPLVLGLTVVLPQDVTGPSVTRALREANVDVLVAVPRLLEALWSGVRSKVGAAGPLAWPVFAGLVRLCAKARKLGLNPGRTVFAPIRRKLGPRLSLLASGGAALDPRVAAGLSALGFGVAEGYGLTETAPLVAVRTQRDPVLKTVGKVLEGTQARIAGPDQNGVGELQVRGPGVFKGYHGNARATEEAFTPDGWFKTGDLGRVDESGRLSLHGRAGTMLVTASGKNVQPEDVEEVLAAHPMLAEAAVLMKDGQLAALAVPDAKFLNEFSATDGPEAVRRAVAEAAGRLPPHLRPVLVRVARAPLARTRLGKIRRGELQSAFEHAETGPAKEGHPPPADPARLAAWQALAARKPKLPLRTDHDLRLDLGLDSLAWMELSLELAQSTGVELDMDDIAGLATVQDLLDLLGAKASKGAAPGPDPLENPEAALPEDAGHWLAPLKPWERVLAWLVFGLVWLLAKTLFRLRVRGRRNLPRHGQLVVAANHTSYLDLFVLVAALGYARSRSLVMAGSRQVAFANPVFRFFCRLAGAVPMDPAADPASSLAYGAWALKNGRGLLWFPEGRRSRDGSPLELRPGLGLILAKHPAPVVPAHIGGAYRAWPAHRALPRIGRITVTFGQVYIPRGKAPAILRNLDHRLRAAAAN